MSQRITEYLHQRKLAKDSDKHSLKSINSDGLVDKNIFGNINERSKSESKLKFDRNKDLYHEADALNQKITELSSDRLSEENFINLKDSWDQDKNLNDSSLSLQDNIENNNLVDLDEVSLETSSEMQNHTLLNQFKDDYSNLSPNAKRIIPEDENPNVTTDSYSVLSSHHQIKIAFIPIAILLLNHILSNLMSGQFLFGLLCGISLTTLFFIIYQILFGDCNSQRTKYQCNNVSENHNNLGDSLTNATCCTRHNSDYFGWWPHFAPCFSKHPNLVSWNDLPRPNIPETQKIPIMPPEITTTSVSLTNMPNDYSILSSDIINNPSATTNQGKDAPINSNTPQNINQTYPSTTNPSTTSEQINYLNIIESCSYLANGLSPTIKANGKVSYKGWMNMVNSYNPYTHRLSMTKSVYIILEETTLKIFRPKRNIARRAMWNENQQNTQPNLSTFISQYTIDMKMTKVALHPVGIVRKRYWSKKYPIYISAKNIKTTTINNSLKPLKSINSESLKKSNSFINANNTNASSTSSPGSLLSGSLTVEEPGLDTISGGGLTNNKATQKIIGTANIYLFGRTDREKESWYRRLYAASIGKPLQITPTLAIRNYIMRNDPISSLNINDNPSSVNNNSSSTSITNNLTRDNRSKSEYINSILGPTTYSVKHDYLSIPTTTTSSGTSSMLGQSNLPSQSSMNNNTMFNNKHQEDKDQEPIYVEYIRYMAKCMPADWLLKSSFAIQLNIRNITCDDQLAWLNALIGRIFWDFFREDHWLEKVKQRIQNKLNKIKVPPFIDPLTVVNVELGNDIPVIRKAVKPFVDTHGVWFELEFVYAGSFALMLETKINLMKSKEIKKEPNDEDDQESSDELKQTLRRVNRNRIKKAVYLSEEEDSAETTTDSDSNNNFDTFEEIDKNPDCENSTKETMNPGVGGHDEEKNNGPQQAPENASQKQSKKAIYRLVDKFAKSTLVQNKVILKGIDYMSKTPLKMRVDVFQLSGTIVLNLPPPPSDRLWFGFRPCPQLKLKAKPQIGVMNISVSRILEWIENKLMHEFERVAVLPNMLDFRVPLLVSDQIDSGPSPLSTSSTNTGQFNSASSTTNQSK